MLKRNERFTELLQVRNSMAVHESTLFLLLLSSIFTCNSFKFEEATIESIQAAFKDNHLTSKQLVQYYLHQIEALNPILHAVIEVNPYALKQAKRADREREKGRSECKGLHGIPILLKDNIATKDELNTTAGSLALLGSVVRRDAGVVRRLRRAGAVILGKASLSEWAHFRSFDAPSGWSARGGQGSNPYVRYGDPCGSSSGSAIAVAANMVAVSLGTETDGSILCPASLNSVVGIKPTVGLTSRNGVIPISPRQDTVGPICRTVSDAVEVLDAIAGVDERDAATRGASVFIPRGGYKQFLKVDGLKGKRIGILRKGFFEFDKGSVQIDAFEKHFDVMRGKGAIVIDNLEIPDMKSILDHAQNDEQIALVAEFKLALNEYLADLLYSPVRSLQDVIAFNNNHSVEERIEELGQQVFLAAQNTSGVGPTEQNAIDRLARLSVEGLEKLMKEKRLDAVVTPDSQLSSVLAVGGYPGISVPAGYGRDGYPFALCFGGLRGSEAMLIEIAFSFEQATKIRRPPTAFKERNVLRPDV